MSSLFCDQVDAPVGGPSGLFGAGGFFLAKRGWMKDRVEAHRSKEVGCRTSATLAECQVVLLSAARIGHAEDAYMGKFPITNAARVLPEPVTGLLVEPTRVDREVDGRQLATDRGLCQW